MNRSSRRPVAALLALLLAGVTAAAQASSNSLPASLTLAQSLDLALKQNPQILKAQQELRRTRGLIIEVRADALPQVTASGQIQALDRDSIDAFPGATQGITKNQEHPWTAAAQVTQLVYSGGRVRSALHAAKLTDQVAVLGLQRTVADIILAVRLSFYQVLLNRELVTVREHSIRLLEQQFEDARRRFDAGTVPHFNVLRAEVELANARPPLIRARNDLRLSKETLAKLLALDTPASAGDFTPINIAGELSYIPSSWKLAEALRAALAQRAEFQQAEKQVAIQKEFVKIAAAGYQPEISVFGGYGIHNAVFFNEIDHTLHGWSAGATATWSLFDGLRTRGKIQQARAQLDQAEIDLADTRRTIELEVRRSYSDYLQALELIEAQKKTVEQAEESVRLAEARFSAGTGTQLDVLSAQTALTDARSNEIQALHDYHAALATLERATGATTRAPE